VEAEAVQALLLVRLAVAEVRVGFITPQAFLFKMVLTL
jgi:hypothetical protein